MKGVGAFGECILHHLLYLDACVCLAGVCKFSEWIQNRGGTAGGVAKRLLLKLCLQAVLGYAQEHASGRALGSALSKSLEKTFVSSHVMHCF